MLFEVNKVYTFKVIGVRIINGKSYYHLDANGTSIIIPMLQYQLQYIGTKYFPTQLKCCYLGVDRDGKYRFTQDRKSIIDEVYEEDTICPFSYKEARIGTNGEEYHIVTDEYFLKHILYGDIPFKDQIPGKEFLCYIKRIDPNGKLKLALADENKEKQGWNSAELILESIGYAEHIDKVFKTFINDKELVKQNSDLKELCKQYDECNNLWIFSYHNFLERYIHDLSESGDTEKTTLFCNLLIALQERLIDDELFLSSFKEEKQEEIKTKAKTAIRRIQILEEISSMINQGKDDDWIRQTYNSLHQEDRDKSLDEHLIKLFVRFLYMNVDYVINNIDLVLDLARLFSENTEIVAYHRRVLIAALKHCIKNNIAQLTELSFKGSTEDIITKKFIIRDILKILVAIICIQDSSEEDAALAKRFVKAQFYRILCLVTPEGQRSIPLRAGYQAILGLLNDETIFCWANVKDFDIDGQVALIENCSEFEANLENNFGVQCRKQSHILFRPTGIMLLPSNSYRPIVTETLPDDELKAIYNDEDCYFGVCSMYNDPIWNLGENIGENLDTWMSLYRDRKYFDTSNNTPSIGDTILVRTKLRYKSMLFNTIIDRNISRDAAMMVSEISNKWVDPDQLHEFGDLFYADVINIREDGGINISVKKYTEQFNNRGTSGISDLRSLYLKENTHVFHVKSGASKLILEYTYLLDIDIKSEKNLIKKINKLSIATSILSLTKHIKSYYYDFLRRYYLALYNFSSDKEFDERFAINKKHLDVAKFFPDINRKNTIYNLLQNIDNLSQDELKTLWEKSQENNTSDSKLTALIVSLSLMKQNGASEECYLPLKSEIVELLQKPQMLDGTLGLSSLLSDGNEEESVISEEPAADYVDMVETEETMELDGLYLHREGNTFIAYAEAVDESDIYITSFSDNGKLLFCSAEGQIITYKYDDILSRKVEVTIPEDIVIDNYFALPINALLVALYKKNDMSYIKLLTSESIGDRSDLDIQSRVQYYILPLGLEQESFSTILTGSNNEYEIPVNDIKEDDINTMVSFGINI